MLSRVPSRHHPERCAGTTCLVHRPFHTRTHVGPAEHSHLTAAAVATRDDAVSFALQFMTNRSALGSVSHRIFERSDESSWPILRRSADVSPASGRVNDGEIAGETSGAGRPGRGSHRRTSSSHSRCRRRWSRVSARWPGRCLDHRATHGVLRGSTTPWCHRWSLLSIPRWARRLGARWSRWSFGGVVGRTRAA